MIKSFTLFLTFTVIHCTALSQTHSQQDSTDTDRPSWSLRLFTGQKYLSFSLYDPVVGQSIRYRPGNPGNLGIGYAYKFLLLDLALRLQLDSNKPTSRFDLQSNLLLKNHFFDIVVQKYTGFEGEFEHQSIFRDDISSFVAGASYLYIKKPEAAQIQELKKGIGTKKDIGSFVYGGYVYYNVLKADSSITAALAPFSPQAQLTNANVFTTGITAGYLVRYFIGNNLFLIAGAMPGISFNVNRTDLNQTFENSIDPGFVLQVKSALGYIRGRHYIALTYNAAYNTVLITERLRYRYEIGNLRLAWGIKFNSKNPINTFLDRISPNFP